MTQEHPIASPSEYQVLKWSDEWFEAKVKHMTREKHLCMQAARWGADQELEACLEEIRDGVGRIYIFKSKLRACLADDIWTVRRFKPPNLKKQALALLDDASDRLDAAHENTIRRALQQLND